MVEETKTNRHNGWFGIAAFSVIALVALTSSIPNNRNLGDQKSEFKWSVSLACIALSLGALGWFAHMAKDRFVGTTTEGGLALIALVVWAAALPVIMKPQNLIANDESGAIINANLYFSAWGAFLMTFVVFMGYMRDVHGCKEGNNNKVSVTSGKWGALMCTSFVVMASAARILKGANDTFGRCDLSSSSDYCKRLKFAVSIGTISGIFCLAWLVVGKKMPSSVDSVMTVVMLTVWCFGVGYITFGDGPAIDIGNLFFGTWGSFGISSMLAGDGINQLMNKSDDQEPAPPAKEEDKAKADMFPDEENAAPVDRLPAAETE